MEFSARNHLSKRHCFQSEAIKTFICGFFATCWTSHAKMCMLVRTWVCCKKQARTHTHSQRKGERQKSITLHSTKNTSSFPPKAAWQRQQQQRQRRRRCHDTLCAIQTAQTKENFDDSNSQYCHPFCASHVLPLRFYEFQLNWKISSTSH